MYDGNFDISINVIPKNKDEIDKILDDIKRIAHRYLNEKPDIYIDEEGFSISYELDEDDAYNIYNDVMDLLEKLKDKLKQYNISIFEKEYIDGYEWEDEDDENE